MPAAVVVPLVTAALSTAGTMYAAKQAEPDAPATTQTLEEQPAAVQTVDTGDKTKEAELLKQKQKRQKQGFLESFGSSLEDSSANYGLL